MSYRDHLITSMEQLHALYGEKSKGAVLKEIDRLNSRIAWQRPPDRRLHISDQTVKFHVSSISGKLGAKNRTDAVRLAVRRGLIAL
jgi:FixJ family two-component response regulator